MKILYILGAYRPNMSANGVCSDGVIKQLIADGHSVTVLANATLGLSKTRFENGVEIITVKPRLYLRLCERAAVLKEKPLISKFISKMAFIINKLQLIITAPIWPKVSPITVSRFQKAALKLQKECGFDAVISVYTPVEALLAGAAVKKQYPKIKFYPYFLDSLSGGYGPRIFSKTQTIKAGLKIEKKVFALADKVILMESSREHQLKLNSEFFDKLVFLDIPLFVPCIHAEIDRPNECKKLLYVGSIPSAIRNPDPLIKMLCEIADENITCEFVGNIDCHARFDVLKQKMGERLVFTGFMPHDLVVQKIADADILLNIGNSNASMVPSKIFEYMSCGKPILSTYVIDNEPSLVYLEKYPLALAVDGRKKDIDKVLLKNFIFNTNRAILSDLEALFYNNTPKAFSNEISN